MTDASTPDLWHAPWPGPWPTWDWRCRVCSEPVKSHPNMLRRLLRRLRKP